MDKFLEMQTYAAVVDLGSFVKAADALEMSKPTVSRYVSELEERLGVRLLQRTTRKLSLTEEGRSFYARCKAVLSDVHAAESEVSSRSMVVNGVIKINVPVSFGLLELAPRWSNFMHKYPDLTLDISLSDRMVDLVEEGFDLAVRIASLPSSSLISRQLSSTRMVLCASPGYLKKHGKPKHPKELAQHAILSYSLLATGDVWEFQSKEGLIKVNVQPIMRSNSGDTCVAAARMNKGIICQPSFMVSKDLKTGALLELMPEFRSPEFGIYAVYPSREHVAPKVRAMIEFLVKEMKGVSWWKESAT